MTRARVILAGVLCAWLADSPAMADDPTKKECAAANETAQDLRRAGKLREARARLAVCTAASCPGPIREDCAQRLKEVQSSTPTIVFDVKDNAGHDLSEVRVSMDGSRLVDRLDGTAIETDPGQHQFVFEADGLRKVEDTAILREGEKDRRVKVVLESMTPVAHKEAAVPSESPSSDSGTRRSFGIALGAAGVAGIGLGSVFGLLAKATMSHALQSECRMLDPNHCTEQGVLDGQKAYGQATVATAAFIGGGALLATGLVLYLSAPRSGDLAVVTTAVNGGEALSLRGRW